MPEFYGTGEYDVAGFAVGSVRKEDLIDGPQCLAEGDVLIGLPSSGVHSNGFSLVRKILQVWQQSKRLRSVSVFVRGGVLLDDS